MVDDQPERPASMFDVPSLQVIFVLDFASCFGRRVRVAEDTPLKILKLFQVPHQLNLIVTQFCVNLI